MVCGRTVTPCTTLSASVKPGPYSARGNYSARGPYSAHSSRPGGLQPTVQLVIASPMQHLRQSHARKLLHPATMYINVTAALANIDDELAAWRKFLLPARTPLNASPNHLKMASEASIAPHLPGSKISPWMPGVELAVVAMESMDWLGVYLPRISMDILVSKCHELGLGTKMGCSRNWRLARLIPNA